jgi:hypothetical protein
MWHCAVQCKFTDVSEEHSAFIFRPEAEDRQLANKEQMPRNYGELLGCMAHSGSNSSVSAKLNNSSS